MQFEQVAKFLTEVTNILTKVRNFAARQKSSRYT